MFKTVKNYAAVGAQVAGEFAAGKAKNVALEKVTNAMKLPCDEAGSSFDLGVVRESMKDLALAKKDVVCETMACFGVEASSIEHLRNLTADIVLENKDKALESLKGAGLNSSSCEAALDSLPDLIPASYEGVIDLIDAAGPVGMVACAGKKAGGYAASHVAQMAGFDEVGQVQSLAVGELGGAVTAAGGVAFVCVGAQAAAGAACTVAATAAGGKALEYGVHCARLETGLTKDDEVLNIRLGLGETYGAEKSENMRNLGIEWFKLAESSTYLPGASWEYIFSARVSKKLHITFRDSDGNDHSTICQEWSPVYEAHYKRFNATNPAITQVIITPLA